MSYNPYKRPGFTMSCFNVNKSNVKKYLENYDRNVKSESELNELKGELARLKKEHATEIVKTRDQLRQALGIIESNHKIINQMRVKSNNNKSVKDAFQETSNNFKKIPHSRNRTEEVESEKSEDESHDRSSVANEFNKRATEDDKRRNLKYKSDKRIDREIDQNKNMKKHSHQKCGQKISFVPAKISARNEKDRYHSDSGSDPNDEDGDSKYNESYSEYEDDSEYSDEESGYSGYDELDGRVGSASSESEAEDEKTFERTKRKENGKRKIKFR